MLRIEYEIKKDGFFGGGSRTISFVQDPGVKEAQLKTSGKTCTIRVPPGLANNSSIKVKKLENFRQNLTSFLLKGPSLTYYRMYNFENEPWWPKFESLRVKYGIEVVKGGDERQARKKVSKKPTEATIGNISAAVSSSNENLIESNTSVAK